MPFIPQSVTRNQENRIGTIIQSDAANQTVVMQDRFGGQFQISLHLHDVIAVMPAVGEVWMAKRIGIDWVLDKRLEDGTETVPFRDLIAGDRRIHSPGDIKIDGKTVTVHGTTEFQSPTTFTSDVTISEGLDVKNLKHGSETYIVATKNGQSQWIAPTDVASYNLINTQTVTAPISSFYFDLSSIPSLLSGYSHLNIKIIGRSDVAATNTDCNLIFNTDTSAVYDWTYFFSRADATNGSSGAVDDVHIPLLSSSMPGGTAPATAAAYFNIDVMSFSSINFSKNVISNATTQYGATTATMQRVAVSGLYVNAAPVTNLTITPGSGNWDVGSAFYLYVFK